MRKLLIGAIIVCCLTLAFGISYGVNNCQGINVSAVEDTKSSPIIKDLAPSEGACHYTLIIIPEYEKKGGE